MATEQEFENQCKIGGGEFVKSIFDGAVSCNWGTKEIKIRGLSEIRKLQGNTNKGIRFFIGGKLVSYSPVLDFVNVV